MLASIGPDTLDDLTLHVVFVEVRLDSTIDSINTVYIMQSYNGRVAEERSPALEVSKSSLI